MIMIMYTYDVDDDIDDHHVMFGIILLAPSPQHPHFFRYTPALNTGLSLSESQQQYQRQSLESFAGYMYTLWVQQDITAR